MVIVAGLGLGFAAARYWSVEFVVSGQGPANFAVAALAQERAGLVLSPRTTEPDLPRRENASPGAHCWSA